MFNLRNDDLERKLNSILEKNENIYLTNKIRKILIRNENNKILKWWSNQNSKDSN